jgi:peptidoglycan hydrolase-like protein with peptidoglycan-binding domain
MKKVKVKSYFTKVVAGSLCALSILSVAVVSPTISPDSSSPFSITANAALDTNQVYNLGKRGTQVKYLQWNLNALNYNCGNADGIYGNATKAAVKKFQSDYGLNSDGIAGKNTLNKMNKVCYSLQDKLCRAGYSCTKDSILGSNTRNKIGEFNSNHNISGNVATSATWKALDQSLIYCTPLTNGAVYRIIPKCAPNSCVDESSCSASVGSNVHLWQYYGNKNQLWVAEYAGNGFYRFKNLGSNLYLDKSGGGNDPSNVIQFSSNNSSAQKWKLKNYGNNWYNIVNQAENQYLDINCCGQSNGTEIQTYWNTNCDAQRFKFERVNINNTSSNVSSNKVNKNAVLNYANTYYNKRNYNYNYYQNNNCCNFVSQCLVAGGLPTNTTFRNGSSAFIYIPSFISYMKNNLNVKYISKPSANQIDVGDVIMTSSSHVMIVTKKIGNQIYANGNTNDRYQFKISSNYFYAVIKTSSLMN